MAEIAFLKTHVAELSDSEPLAVNLQRYGRFLEMLLSDLGD